MTPRLARRTIPALVAILAAGLSLTGCSSNAASVKAGCAPAHSFHTVKAGTLQVASFEYAPFVSFTADGDASGLDADVWKAIAKTECLELDVKNSNQAAAIQAVQTNRVDVMGGDLTRTKERTKILTLSDPVWVDEMAIISKSGGYPTVDSLKGKTVGTINGNYFNADMEKVLGASAMRFYPGSPQVYADLKSGRIDALLDATTGASVQAKGYEIQVPQKDPAVAATVAPAQSCYAVSLSNKALDAAINADVAQLRVDGTLARLAKKYGQKDSVYVVGKPRLL